jgi:hypothetical protein
LLFALDWIIEEKALIRKNVASVSIPDAAAMNV